MTAPKRPSRLRRLLIGIAVLVGLVALAVVTTPWWWPYAARRVLERQGVTFARFETLGYKRFALHDVRFENESVVATVNRVEADSPVVWAVRGLFFRPGAVVFEKWEVRVSSARTAGKPGASAIRGWPDLRLQLHETLTTLQQWLPEARATDGAVYREKQHITLRSAGWLASEGRLTVEELAWRDHRGHAELRWHDREGRITFSAATENDQFSVLLETREMNVTGQLALWNQPVRLQATFPAQGWIPETAELTADNLAVPGSVAKLGDFYPTLQTRAHVRWQNARFTLDLRAVGQPAENQSVPPLTMDIAGQGDPESLQIERFNISLPGTTAGLLAPIVINREAQILSGPSQFSLESDLEKFPGQPDLRGKITGQVRVQPDGENVPRLLAALEAREVRAAGFDVKAAVFEAEQLGPKLTVKKSSITFADGSHAEVKGEWDWSTRIVSDGSLEGEINAAAFARVLPPSLSFSKFSVSARAAGHWPELVHSGKLDVAGLTAGTPKPVAVEAEWKGTGVAAESFQLEAKTGASALSLEGRLGRDEARIATATITLPDAPKLELVQPAVIRWRPALSIENLDFAGEGSGIRATWLDASARLEGQKIKSAWLQDLVTRAEPAWQLDALTFEGRWPDGALTADARVAGQIEIGKDKAAQIDLRARAQPSGVFLERLVVTDAEGPVLEARGNVPYVITPTALPAWKLAENGSWSLAAETAPDSPFWKAQAAATGVTLTAPRLVAKIEGSAKKPDAYIDLQAEEITFERARVPTLSKFSARLVLEENRIALERFSIFSAGQTLTASGQTSVSPGHWKELPRNPRLLWSGDAEAHLHMPAIDLSAFATFLPEALAPTGVLDGDLTVKADGTINGAVKITDASTHPISPFGSFNQIRSEIIFDGREATLKSLTALVSGQRVEAKGSVQFPAGAPLKLDLTLAGKNLPLARQTGLLLRGDIDLQLKSSAEGITTIGGNVNLHDGLFLRDVRSLIPKRGGGAASRPPYFSVTKRPFRDWQLAVKVGGHRFIQLRTPLFNGVVSGDFQLRGTLFEPIAIGQATFDEGVVLLPFASLRLRSGSVRLTQADPYTPQLALNAESRTLGYDVRMDLSGPASDPVLVFSSSPPLSSEQILLMVMAGETPRSDITYSGSQRAIGIGTYLGKSLFSGLFGGSGGSERWTISSGENVSEGGQETYNVEYMLNQRWSVVGERDEFDDYNIGFKRRLLTKKKKDADAASR